MRRNGATEHLRLRRLVNATSSISSCTTPKSEIWTCGARRLVIAAATGQKALVSNCERPQHRGVIRRPNLRKQICCDAAAGARRRQRFQLPLPIAQVAPPPRQSRFEASCRSTERAQIRLLRDPGETVPLVRKDASNFDVRRSAVRDCTDQVRYQNDRTRSLRRSDPLEFSDLRFTIAAACKERCSRPQKLASQQAGDVCARMSVERSSQVESLHPVCWLVSPTSLE